MLANSRGIWLTGLIAATLAWLAASIFPALRLAENWLSDAGRISIAPAPDVPKDIVLVTITEETLATLPYRSPINRNLLADIVDKAVSARAAGLAIDILFDQPTEEAADLRLRASLQAAAQTMPVSLAYATGQDNLTSNQTAFLNAFTDGLPRGIVNLPEDADDGIVRWRQVGRAGAGGSVVPGLVSALAAGPESGAARAGIAPLAYSRSAPGVVAEFVSYPAHALTVLPDDWLAQKYLLVGADLPHSDRHRTPFSAVTRSLASSVPGVAIHAHGLNQIRAGIELTESPWWAAPLLALVVAAAVAWAFGIERALVVRAAVSSMFVAAYAGASAVALARWGLFLPLVSPILAGALAGGMQGGREWVVERRRRAFIYDAFSRYLSPSVVKLLIDEPDRLRLGGEERVITYVFTDLAGFTSFTERNSPQVLVDTLNTYLDNMCRIALEHEATIDKIVGDAVVAFFGAPADQEDHAQRAVHLALAYDRFSEIFRAQMKARGLEIGVTRVGIHSGPAIVGNFGGNRFFNYTGHGDMVNTAARMESVNKHLGTRICISGVTAAQCKDVIFRPVGTLILVGKTQGLACFEPVSDETPGYAPLAEYRAAFDRMAANDPRAGDTFRELAARYPNDPLVALHATRLGRSETGARIVMTEK